MRKPLIVLYILALSLFANAQQITRIANSPYPTSPQKPDKLFLISESIGYSQKLALQSLPGMLAYQT